MIDHLMRMLSRLPGAHATVEHGVEQEERVQAVELHIDSLLIRAEHIGEETQEGRSVERE